jgi:hypothetical protein
MKKTLVASVVACAALAGTASPALAQNCSSSIKNAGALKAKNVSCKRARKVMTKHYNGAKKPLGFTCHYKAYEGGVTWTCKKDPNKQVQYSIAD